MTDAEEFILSTYVTIKDLSITNISRVSLVRNSIDQQLYIRRTLPRDCRKLYNILKAYPFSGIPEIKEVLYNGNTIVFEEYVEGYPLSNVFTTGITYNHFLSFMKDLLLIMQHLHLGHICHRDIKEENILIRPDQSMVLIDFAIAALVSCSDEEISCTDALGTITYAAPEQFGLAPTDCRSDIFSFGMVCQNLLNECSDISASQKHMWETIIEKCTEFYPQNRYQTVDEILQVIEQPALFYGDAKEHIISFVHSNYPLCIQVHNNECKTLTNLSPYDRITFSEDIFADVDTNFSNRERLTEFFLLDHSILAVRMIYSPNPLHSDNVISNLYQARIILLSSAFQIEVTDVYESLLGFSVLGDCEALLNRDTLITYPL